MGFAASSSSCVLLQWALKKPLALACMPSTTLIACVFSASWRWRKSASTSSMARDTSSPEISAQLSVHDGLLLLLLAICGLRREGLKSRLDEVQEATLAESGANCVAKRLLKVFLCVDIRGPRDGRHSGTAAARGHGGGALALVPFPMADFERNPPPLGSHSRCKYPTEVPLDKG